MLTRHAALLPGFSYTARFRRWHEASLLVCEIIWEAWQVTSSREFPAFNTKQTTRSKTRISSDPEIGHHA